MPLPSSATPFAGVLLALLAFAGCAGPVDLSDRSAFTARPLDDFAPVGGVDAEALAAAHPGVGASFLLYETAMEHLFYLPQGGPWEFVVDDRRQYVVLDPEEERWTTIRIAVGERGELEGYFGRVTNPDGSVHTFTRADLVEERDDDGRVYSLAYPGVTRGSVVEEALRTRYAYRRNTYLPPLSHEIPLQFDVPVDTLRVRYVYPSSWALQIKQTGPNRMPRYDVQRDVVPGKTALLHESRGVAAVPDEPFAPFFAEMASYLEFQVTEIYAGLDRLGLDKIYEAPKDWERYADGFTRYVLQSGTLFSDPSARAAAEVVQASDPDTVKLAEIVRWVQRSIEADPRSSADSYLDVLNGRSGNAFFVAGLAQAMLAHAGLDAQYLLIHPAEEGYLDEAYVHDSEFRVPAVGVTVDGERRVVFPYIESLPVDYIPEAYQGQTAMRITAEGFGGFEETPTLPAAESAVDENYVVRVDEDGVLEVEEEKVLRGAAAYAVRRLLDDADEAEREEALRDLLTYDEGEVLDFAYTVENEADYAQPLVIRLTYGIDHLVTVTPEEVVFQTGGLLSPAALGEFRAGATTRQTPIRIYNGRVENKRIVVEYPASWTLTTVLEDVQDENRFGSLAGRHTVEPGRLTVEQRLHLRAVRATPQSYPALLRLTGSGSQLNVPTLLFEVQS